MVGARPRARERGDRGGYAANVMASARDDDSSAPDVVVVGCGVVGLAAALTLRARGLRVEAWSRDDAAETVSAVAAAIWYPFLAEPRERVLRWSAATCRQLQRFAAEEPASGVVMQDVVEVFATDAPDLWWAEAAGGVARMAAADVPPGYAAAIRARVPVCSVPTHLPWLRARAERAGVRFVRRAIRSLDEALARAPLAVHCAGLGARELCGDATLRAVRGQVLLVDPVPGVAAFLDETAAQPFYAVPRDDGLVLGGTAQDGDERLAADDADTATILAGMAARLPALRGARVRAVRVGLRPCRPTVRLEREDRGGGRAIVHCYGHGGSGYTLSWGCAEDVAQLVGG